MKMMQKSSNAQIWVETVIYTVIGLAIIGIVLAIATPAIDKYKDKLIIEQTIDTLNNINKKFFEVRDEGLGNRRIIEFGIKKGSLTIDGSNDYISYIMEETGLEYSEAGEEVSYEDIKVKTEKKGRKYNLTLSLSYEDIDLHFNTKDGRKKFNPATTSYKIFAENNGTPEGRAEEDREKIQILIGES